MTRKLCPTCQSFNLSRNDFYNTREWLTIWNADDALELGTCVEVLDRSTSCPLCYLATQCLDLSNPSCPLKNPDGTPTTCRLRWMGSQARTYRPHGGQITPIFLEPKLVTWGEENWITRSNLLPCGEDMLALGSGDDPFCGRISSASTEYFPLVKSWFQEIASLRYNRGFTPSQFSRGSISKLLVIDVQSGQLVDVPISARYFALSYVWGSKPFFTTLLSNVAALKAPGGLFSILSQLPKTIVDAITLLQSIGEKYLWVDSLCIVQDDPKNKHTLVARMDEVYGCAFAAIVARSGKAADEGLFGVHPWVWTEDVGGQGDGRQKLRLVSIPDFRNDKWLEEVPYEDRAWTFQEHLLSPVLLTFTHGLISLTTPLTTYRTDVSLESIQAPQISSQPTAFDFSAPTVITTIASDPLPAYNRCLKAYSLRKMSYLSDSLNAFTGVGKVISQHLQTVSHFGIPIAIFDMGLLWHSESTEKLECKKIQDTLLPSWSWAAWTGYRSCEMISHEFDFLISHTWIRYYFDDVQLGAVRPLRDLENVKSSGGKFLMSQKSVAERKRSNSERYRDTMKLCNRGLLVPTARPFDIDSAFWKYSEDSRERYLRLTTVPEVFPKDIPLKEGSLRFFTICANFRLAPKSEESSNNHQNSTPPEDDVNATHDDLPPPKPKTWIFDRYNNPCGLITSPSPPPPDLHGTYSFLIMSEQQGYLYSVSKSEEYVARLNYSKTGKVTPGHDPRTGRYLTPKPYEGEKVEVWDEYNALLVEWMPDGRAERRGVGVVFKAALDQAVGESPVWREVVLG